MNATKQITATFALSVSLLASTAFAEPAYPLLDELFALSEDQIDIGLVALKLAKEISPGLDVNDYSKKIDNMAAMAKMLTSHRTDPDYRIRALNTFLYKTYKIEYALDDPNGIKPVNRYLNGILDTKKGSCVTLPLLYLEIAQRLDYPVYPVALPNHLILRYVDQKLKYQNIEATGSGGYVPDDEYKFTLSISEQGIKSGAYLRTLLYREFVGDLIADNAVYFGNNGDLRRAVAYMHKAIQMNPKFADHYLTISKMYAKASQKSTEPFKSNQWNMAQASFRRADELGVVRLSNTNYIEEQKKLQAEYRSKKGK